MARRGSYLSRQIAQRVSRYALPERLEPSADVFAASVFCQRWEHVVTHTATTFYVLALSPENALTLGQIRLEKMGGAQQLQLATNTRMDGYGWAFTEMVLQSESQEEKDARVALWHEQHPHRVCMECGVPWNGIHRGCSCDAPPHHREGAWPPSRPRHQLMPCDVRGNTIICSRGLRSQTLCADCKQAPSTLLCDGPLPPGILHRRSSVPGGDTTCSRPLCRHCAHKEDGKDFCRFCAEQKGIAR